MFTFFYSSQIAFVRALEVPNVVSKCGFVSQGWIVECCVVAVQSSLPNCITVYHSGLSESVGAGRSLLDLKQRTVKAKENRKEGGIVYSICGTFMCQ